MFTAASSNKKCTGRADSESNAGVAAVMRRPDTAAGAKAARVSTGTELHLLIDFSLSKLDTIHEAVRRCCQLEEVSLTFLF